MKTRIYCSTTNPGALGGVTMACVGVLLLVWSMKASAAFTPGNLAVFSADSAGANNTPFTILELNPTANQISPVNSIPINGSSGPNALRTSGSASSTGYLADNNDGTLLAFTGHN